MRELAALAAAHGIEPVWRGVDGVIHEVPRETLEALLRALAADPLRPGAELRRLQAEAPLPVVVAKPGAALAGEVAPAGATFVLELESGSCLEGRVAAYRRGVRLGRPLPPGRHRLRLGGRARHLIVAPDRCLAPSDLGLIRSFGLSSQLHALRTQRPSPLGDLADLGIAVEAAAGHGADLFGVNPLHALFMADPGTISPYAPSSRRFVHPLYIALDAAAARLGHALEEEAAVAPDELIDHPRAARMKQAALERLWAGFGPDHPLRPDFLTFRRAGGDALQRFCLFETLHERALIANPADWAFRSWSAGWQRPDTAEVQSIAIRHRERVEFFAFLQWLAAHQLAEAQRRARAVGMRLGLYHDLAVGVHPAGAQVWADPGATVRGVSIGAPPDPFSPKGQVWGLAPFSPAALEASGYESLLADLDATARHAGAMRIDHVIGLSRQFWVPDGMDATAGGYVRFPFDTVARLAALVSHRHRCLVVGEDLGTVPPGFRRRMQRYGLLSSRVLWFERHGARYRPPAAYPEASLASLSTHDLPTQEGYWAGRDIDWRQRLGLFGDKDAERERRTRAVDCRRLIAALAAEAIPAEPIEVALHRFLGRARAALVLIQLEDLAGWLEQVNLPGTIDAHPNWRRRFTDGIEEILASTRAQAILDAVRAERPR